MPNRRRVGVTWGLGKSCMPDKWEGWKKWGWLENDKKHNRKYNGFLPQ